MGTYYAPLEADLFLFCHKRKFMLFLSHENRFEVIEAFNFISRYLDDLLNIVNNIFNSIAIHIYSSELRLTSEIQRPHFWIYSYLYRMVQNF